MSVPPDKEKSAIERLAEKVLKGDVVFFVGSGFSIDSEKNTTSRLVCRLLVRLAALDEAIGGKILPGQRQWKIGDLLTTFELRDAPYERFPFTREHVDKLALRYYELNDWFCDAFGELLVAARSRRPAAPFLKSVQRIEEELRRDVLQPRTGYSDAVSFKLIDAWLIRLANTTGAGGARLAGKALFLETMGFSDECIMGGRPEGDAQMVAQTYAGRLFPRHLVLARLAREGLCPAVITTNFDLLLEGAYRCIGFPFGKDADDPMGLLVSNFERIASRTDFFTRAKAFRTAMLLKMHGCAQTYRLTVARTPRGKSNGWPDRLQSQLQSMVFTYREIQNWREDSWAAEFLRSLLRTRVVVFCGYSLQDPVIHDTFRTVYEEMGKALDRRLETPAPAKEAPAFFFAGKQPGERDFYGMAMLNAASAAVGAASGSTNHPNYVRFNFRGGEARFPNVDEQFLWLFHIILRQRQQECLRDDLRRLTTLLLGGPAPESQLDRVRQEFTEIVVDEMEVGRAWERNEPKRDAYPDAVAWNAASSAWSEACRLEHTNLSAWSDRFHTGLLREFASADAIRRRQGAGLDLGQMRRHEWYFPTMQDGGWTAWGAVVELAIRRMSEAAGATPAAAAHPRPTLLLGRDGDVGGFLTPRALGIEVAGFGRTDARTQALAQPARQMVWEVSERDAPWPIAPPPTRGVRRSAKSARVCRRPAPHAALLWKWAAGLATETDVDSAREQLGLDYEKDFAPSAR